MFKVNFKNCMVSEVNVCNVSSIYINNYASQFDNMNIYMDQTGMNSKIVELEGNFATMKLKINSPIILQGNGDFSLDKNISVDVNDEKASLVLRGNFKNIPGIELNSSCKLINDKDSNVGQIKVDVLGNDSLVYIGTNFQDSEINIKAPSEVNIATNVQKLNVDKDLEKKTTIILNEEINPKIVAIDIKSPIFVDGIASDIENFKASIVGGTEMITIDKQGAELQVLNGKSEAMSMLNFEVGKWQVEGFVNDGDDFISIGTINIEIIG